MRVDTTSLISHTFGHQIRVRSCGILIVKDQLLLVGHQFGKEEDKLFWSFPGGGVDFGETLQEAIVREFKEETGLTVKVGSFLFIYEYIKPPLHALEFYFKIDAAEGELILGLDPELPTNHQIIKEIGFFDNCEIQNSSNKEFHDILQKINNFDELLNLKGHF